MVSRPNHLWYHFSTTIYLHVASFYATKYLKEISQRKCSICKLLNLNYSYYLFYVSIKEQLKAFLKNVNQTCNIIYLLIYLLSEHSIINVPLITFLRFFVEKSDFSAKIFQIMVNSNLLCTVKDAEVAIALLIAMFYIFNIEYPVGVVNVMELAKVSFQRLCVYSTFSTFYECNSISNWINYLAYLKISSNHKQDQQF